MAEVGVILGEDLKSIRNNYVPIDSPNQQKRGRRGQRRYRMGADSAALVLSDTDSL